MRYNESSWREALIQLEPFGKAAAKYGERVYQFSAPITLSVIMPRRGWILIKRTKSYVYLQPPTEAGKPPFKISIKIPSKAQALEIANQCHKNGESWKGQLGEWPAFYFHEMRQELHEFTFSKDQSEYPEKRIYTSPSKSFLHIGEFGIWSVELTKTDGEFNFYESGSVISDQKPTSSTVLVEGAELSVELTKYERNPVAREKCLEHFGPICQVCSIDFEKTYGQIGKGFIHVHHITPMSVRSGEYEIDPYSELIPLCPNCHAMIHRRNPPFTVDELRNIYRAGKF